MLLRGGQSGTPFALVAMLLVAACTRGGSPTPAADASHVSSPATPDSAATSGSTATGGIDLSTLRGRIVFSAGPPHAEDVYVINADGTGLRRVTHDPAADFDPTWSPDGRRIAFRHQPGDDTTTDIYVIDASGSHLRNLTHSPGIPDWGPAWSPNGRLIAWNSDRHLRGTLRGYLMHTDGSGVQPLAGEVWVEYPAWSPDGRKLAFMGQTPEGSENYEIYVINVDGTALRRLTTSEGPDGWPRWSPDGRRILFASTRDDCRYSQAPDCKTTGDIGPYHTLYVMNADGANQHRLSDLYGQIPAWSPDGRHIAFEGRGGLTIMRADGTDSTLLPIDVPSPDFPDWTK